MKKLFIISAAVFLVLIAAFAIWFFAGRNKTVPAGEAIRELLPFGSAGDIGQPTVDERQPTAEEINSKLLDENGVPATDLFRLSDAPVAGAVAFTRGTQTVVRFVERATGHVVETVLPKDDAVVPLEQRKITNNTIPKVYEAYFRPDGAFALLRTLENDSDTQRNLILGLTSTSSTAVNLRGEITGVAVGPGNVLYYADRSLGTVVSSPWSGSPVRTALASPFTDWRITPSGSSIAISSKASAEAPGFAYTVGAGGTLTKILGPLTALSVTPNGAGTSVLYSYNAGGVIRTATKNIRTGAETEISPATLAEKCAWSSKQDNILYCGAPVEEIGGNEPDSWYRGASSFSDRFWKFDVNREIAEVVLEPKSLFGVDIDVIRPQLSPLEDYLIFINKRDMTLWAFKLPQP